MKQQIPKLVANGLYKEALSLYTHHHSAALPPHKFTFPPLLKACAKLQSTIHGQMLHCNLIKAGFLFDVYTATALTDMYMKLRRIDEALKVFVEMPERNMASINATISGFLRNGHCSEALRVFNEMGSGSFRPNSVTLAILLSSCENVEQGRQMHCWSIKLGVEMDTYVATSLVTMYSNYEELVFATKVFGEMPDKRVVSYNAFVSGLRQNGVPRLVLDVFKDMMKSSFEEPNSVTLISVISACTSLLYLQFGRQVHGFVKKTEMQYDTKVGTGLVDMYSKCGCWHWAYDIFKELNCSRNLITWNSLISGMMLNGQSETAVRLFELLGSEGLEPDSTTWNSIISGFSHLGLAVDALKWFGRMQSTGRKPTLKCITSLLPACSVLSALKQGKEIHGHAIRIGISNDEFIATALIDMYMKCGYFSSARRIFDQFEIKPEDPAFWNAMISGYGKNGEYESAFEIFNLMQDEKVNPISATFTSVLSMCSHTGQVDRGWQVFQMIGKDHNSSPTPEQFGCMIDLLSRSGRLYEARELIQEMPDPPSSVFSSLLGACRSDLNSELGEEMAVKLSELEPENPSPLVILSNIYAGLERWRDVERIRQMISDRGLKKLPGLSSAGNR
ncbi:hypothetical protein SLE2022_335220 [Rubroshorea leprosula]